jgi:hypothetical protein
MEGPAVKRTKALMAAMGVALFAALTVASPSEAATAGQAGTVSPLIHQVACNPYNGWFKFDNTLAGDCFADSGDYKVGPAHYLSWCSGNNAGWFQWDTPDGQNVATSFGKWQCGPLSEADTVWTIHIY